MSTVTLCDKVASTFITKIAYDADALVLVVQIGPKVYGYAGVPQSVADAMTTATVAPGRLLNEVIKPLCPLVFSATADQL